jgi:hypothetical protein
VNLSYLADRIDHIKRRLAALDDGCGEAAPEAAVALERFEARASAGLPEEYRAFLCSIGRIPAIVPFYGMVPPGHAAYHTDKPSPIAHLVKPFPFVENWIWEDDPECSHPSGEWTAEMCAKWDTTAHGLLWLGTDGCALNFGLVVTGEKRGEVWAIADVGVALAEDGAASFLDWLERRINRFATDKDAQQFRNRPRFPDPWWSYL